MEIETKNSLEIIISSYLVSKVNVFEISFLKVHLYIYNLWFIFDYILYFEIEKKKLIIQ